MTDPTTTHLIFLCEMIYYRFINSIHLKKNIFLHVFTTIFYAIMHPYEI